MKAILCLFDSLNLRALSCYGGPNPTPNFDRLAARSVQCHGHMVGSMPCMPARRDLMTGRLNFLHRSWGPLEPFDQTLTHALRMGGIHSHLVTDHYHYFEAGGATYHTDFDSWEYIRGQEADPWVPAVNAPVERFARTYHPAQVEGPGGYRFQGMLNRQRITKTADFPAVKTFDHGLAFLSEHGAHDNWFLQIECFDPHEPFTAPPEYRAAFPTDYHGPTLDWPRYKRADAPPSEDAELRANYAALVALCDAQLGRLLDAMDAGDLWRDTALIVTTDHGFLLGEHDWWGKNRMPFFNEIAHIPLFIHLPGQAPGACHALSQNIDLMPTLLDMFQLPQPATVRGTSLLPVLTGAAGRDIALYGIFGGALNATDGRFTYFRYPPDMEGAPLFEYTLMPQHTASAFGVAEMQGATLHAGFDFTQTMPVLKIPAIKGAKRPPMQGGGFDDTATVLYDLANDPGQTTPLDDPQTEARLLASLTAAMQAHDAPPELFHRFNLPEAA